jgi:gas vesicle protein
MSEQKPVPVWVLILIILGILVGGWVGGAGLILIFDKVSSVSASTPRDDAEILRRMKEIEAQHASIESRQEVMIDEMKAQSSDPTSIAKLQEQYVSLSERLNWVLKGMGAALMAAVAWAAKQIKMAAAITSELKKVLDNLQTQGAGGGGKV